MRRLPASNYRGKNRHIAKCILDRDPDRHKHRGLRRIGISGDDILSLGISCCPENLTFTNFKNVLKFTTFNEF